LYHAQEAKHPDRYRAARSPNLRTRLPMRSRAFKLVVTLAVASTFMVLASAAQAQKHGKAGPVMAADGSIDGNRYYTSGETNAILQAYARRYPHLTKLYSIGRSWRGADL